MSTTLDLSGLDRIQAGLRALGDPDATDLMVTWMGIIDDDNRTGILHGLDKDGMPMVPVTYRPAKSGPLKPDKGQRSGRRPNARKGVFLSMIGPWGGAGGGNLTSSEYRLLGGPPLAPRDQFSRVIANLKSGYGQPGFGHIGPGLWQSFAYWDEVVSTTGRPFLQYHFDGTGKLPRRDLRGVRPAGIQKAVAALQNWARDKVRQAFGRGGP